MAAYIVDVAREAGVSVATVSRVLARSPSEWWACSVARVATWLLRREGTRARPRPGRLGLEPRSTSAPMTSPDPGEDGLGR